MVGIRIRFTGQLAPCGKTLDGEFYRDEDDEGLIIRDEYYDCGCRTIRHEYHDGSVRVRATRHNGTVVMDEFIRD